MVIFKKIDNSKAHVVWVEGPEDPRYQSPYQTLDNIYALHPEGYLFDPKFQKRRFTGYDGKIHLYKMLPSTIPLGLVREAARSLRQHGWTVQLEPEIVSSFVNPINMAEKVDSFCKAIQNACGLAPRDYQRRMLEQAISSRRSAYRAATGAGKSLAIYMIVRFFAKMYGDNQKFLIMVPNKGLVNQLYQNFESDYKWLNLADHVGMYHSEFTGKEKVEALKKKIVISTWQSMGNLLDNPKMSGYFQLFTTLIIDELHTAKNDLAVINRVVSACSNAENRFGMTGTIPRNVLNQKVIIGNFGDITQIITSKELIDRGELSKATIIEVKIPYDDYTIKLCRKKKVKYNEEIELARLCGAAEEAVSSLLTDGIITPEQNTLILMNKVANGEVDNMIEMLKTRHPEYEIRKVHGKVSMNEREEIRLGVEGKKGVIIVATFRTFGTGINMKNLHNVIFGSSTKSYTLILQSIGRSLRLHSSKDMARVFDLHHCIEESYYSKRVDAMMEFKSNLSRHFFEREEFYYEEDFPQEVHTIDKVFSFKDVKLDNIDIENATEVED